MRSRVYSGNDYILVTDIGEGDDKALLCFTDLIRCCDSTSGAGALGQWFFPDGSPVGDLEDGKHLYVTRGASVVRLNRRNNAASPTQAGEFCCQIPNSSSNIVRICVNVIGKCVNLHSVILFSKRYTSESHEITNTLFAQLDPQRVTESQASCTNELITTAGVTVLVVIVIESLIAIPVILIIVISCFKR